MAERAILDLTLRGLLEELAGDDPKPGSGAVAALVGAMGAALLTMTARMSRGDWSEAPGIGAQAESLRSRLQTLAQTNADAYAAVLAELESPAGDTSLGRAFARAAELPLEIARAAADVAELASVAADRGDPRVRADASAAAALAAGASRAAAGLVRVNLTATEDDDRVRGAEEAAEAAAFAARRLLWPDTE